MDKRIKELRNALELTQQAFADRIGTARGNIACYEVGKNTPSDAVITLICREFNVNEKWLRTGDGEMFKERPPADEVASYAEDLLDHKEEENPFYDIIIEMMRTYHELDTVSQQAALNYFRLLKKNLEQKKEG